MAVRFYVDADILGLAKLLVTVRADVTYPGDPGGRGIDGLIRAPCPIHPGEKDTVWLPQVAAQGWVILTRDRRLRSRPAERQAILDNGAKVVILESRASLSKWGQLEVVVPRWRRFEELADLPGPWLYVATRSGLRSQELHPA